MIMTEKLLWLGLGVTAIGLLSGIVYQTVGAAVDRQQYPPLGQLVDLGGFRLHLHCMGQGTPTVVMDAGAGAPAITWGLVPSEIAQFSHVCVYDRAGLGWSEPNLRRPRTSQQSVEELHTLLTKAGLKPPYILVGHSLGGANMRLYASQYPEDVVGLVLVDASHESYMTAETWKGIKKELWLYQVLRVASRVGVLRLMGELNLLPMFKAIKQEIQKYPLAVQALFDTYKAYCYRPHYWATVASERAHLETSFAQFQAVTSLHNLPLVVLIQGVKAPAMSDASFQRWQALQFDLTKLSSHSKAIIAENSGHLIPLEQPDLIVSAVRQLVERD
ncbi:alpha/beta fold hydrolase [Trichocoleus desertorum]